MHITENNFMKNGVVKYEDSSGNRLLIKSDLRGANFTAKCRPKDKNIKISAITFEYPYDIDGFNLTFEKEAMNQEELSAAIAKYEPFFKEVISVLERWVVINYELTAFYSDTSKLSQITLRKIQKENPDATKEDVENALLGDILTTLCEFEEMSEFLSICTFNNPKQ